MGKHQSMVGSNILKPCRFTKASEITAGTIAKGSTKSNGRRSAAESGRNICGRPIPRRRQVKIGIVVAIPHSLSSIFFSHSRTFKRRFVSLHWSFLCRSQSVGWDSHKRFLNTRGNLQSPHSPLTSHSQNNLEWTKDKWKFCIYLLAFHTKTILYNFFFMDINHEISFLSLL